MSIRPSVSAYGKEQVEIRTGYEPEDVWVQISLDELRTVIETLRERGVEVGPGRAKQQELVCELARSLGVAWEKLAEPADR